MIRLFVALDIPAPLRQRLHAMGKDIPGARPAPRDQIHLTLRFIGEVDDGMALDIEASLAAVRSPPFSLSVRGVGCFPHRGTPRVLWAGLSESRELDILHTHIENRLIACGLPPEPGKFSPHITLARLRDCPRRQADAFLADKALFRSEDFPVEGFVLYASRLLKSGAVHVARASWPLGAT
ncbi:MAG: RNA 2',3'-cyclic phosphodiesterase [Desulfocapsaceae bacterium]|nr:RNA 2',3'-cyclic phosphodiesterase [Desulfocapsaceae bacterium]